MRVYLAAQYNQKLEIAAKKRELQALGITVTSTWTDESHDPNTSLKDLPDDTLRALARRDKAEIRHCDMLVLFTLDPDTLFKRGGRIWESGYAEGEGKIVAIIGPRENIFYYDIPKRLIFPTWEDFLRVAEKEGWAG